MHCKHVTQPQHGSSYRSDWSLSLQDTKEHNHLILRSIQVNKIHVSIFGLTLATTFSLLRSADVFLFGTSTVTQTFIYHWVHRRLLRICTVYTQSNIPVLIRHDLKSCIPIPFDSSEVLTLIANPGIFSEATE